MSNKEQAALPNTSVWVVIPAAGVGSRMQADRPKQYLPLAESTVIEQTIACFEGHPQVAGIVVAISADDPYWTELPIAKRVQSVTGGRERASSVLNALDYLLNTLHLPDMTAVLVHDAARPCLLRQDIDRLLAAGLGHPDGAILAVPVRDTMKRAQPDKPCIAYTEDRSSLWHALTPQMAPLGVLYNALLRALQQGLVITDEASALEYCGFHPVLVEGEAGNIKITRGEDLLLAGHILKARCLP